MKHLSFVYPFYRNSGMLAKQYEVWSSYPEDLKQLIDVVVVDDGSPEPAFDVPRPDGLPDLQMWRIQVDIPWNQHGARNLGAKMAEGPWLFLTDIDHILPVESLRALIGIKNKALAYTFHRLDIHTMKPHRRADGSLKPHPNTYAMTKELFWKIGGYDEDFKGYGTDSLFRHRMAAMSSVKHLREVPIYRVPREVIPDASTTTLGDRKDPAVRCNKKAVLAKKVAEGREDQIVTLDFPYERVL